MATVKLTITLDESQLEEVRAIVKSGRSPTLSAFVKHAVGIALHDASGWREMLDDSLQQTGGPLTGKERAWADAILSPKRSQRSPRTNKAA